MFKPERLRSVLGSKGITEKTIAKKVGLSPVAFSRRMTKKIEMTLELSEKIAEAAGMSFDQYCDVFLSLQGAENATSNA